MKCNHKTFVHLVGLYTYCKMMRGSYNVKLLSIYLYLFCLFCYPNISLSLVCVYVCVV
jgi:hypothetical protein